MPERKTAARAQPVHDDGPAVMATRGQFTYQDHGTPWSIVARNLDGLAVTERRQQRLSRQRVVLERHHQDPELRALRRGHASRFKLVGGKVHFDRIDLISDGATSVVDGEVDFRNWPEQIYQVKSHIDFPTQKNIFFHRDRFTVSGQGDFEGTFHLFKGGRELKGTFTSPLAGVNDWRFPNLRGAVLWLPDRLEITDSTSELYGGTARFDYRMAPFGKKGAPTPRPGTCSIRDVDLSRLTDFLETRGLRLAGRASGRNRSSGRSASGR